MDESRPSIQVLDKNHDVPKSLGSSERVVRVDDTDDAWPHDAQVDDARIDDTRDDNVWPYGARVPPRL